MTPASGLALYRLAARDSARPVIRRYSSSFRLASALYPKRVRGAIASIYALVRVADEIVDGTAAEAGADPRLQRAMLDELEADVERALRICYSPNVVVQAFADVAQDVGFGADLTGPFFAAMRRDLDPVEFGEDEYRDYIYGSAEVIGLMCLAAFRHGHGDSREAKRSGRSAVTADPSDLEQAARALGAAFQKVNFLRDLAFDQGSLGRQYIPNIRCCTSSGAVARQGFEAAVVDIRGDLAVARGGIELLPADCRLAVASATAIFSELLRRIERAGPAGIAKTRISVPSRTKLALIAREWVRHCAAKGTVR